MTPCFYANFLLQGQQSNLKVGGGLKSGKGKIYKLHSFRSKEMASLKEADNLNICEEMLKKELSILKNTKACFQFLAVIIQ